jgi:hypothetical protein
LDEITQPPIDLRAPYPLSGFPAPEAFKASAMPAKDRLRLNDMGYIEQMGPNPRHPHQYRPITAMQAQTRRCSPQGNVELLTEKQVFDFKPAQRLEHIGDKHSERMQDRKHQPE